MFTSPVKSYPIGNRIRGTNLYYSSHTGVNDWSRCQQCVLRIGRRRVCVRSDGERLFGGKQPIRLLFIGESPGKTENATGIPFTGASGRVLKQIFTYCKESFIFCITNTICCQPKDTVTVSSSNVDSEDNVDSILPEVYEFDNFNRKPKAIEIAACSSHVYELTKTFKPQGVVLLGLVARNAYPIHSVPSLELTHPAYICRQEFKVLLMKQEARQLYNFITDIRDKEKTNSWNGNGKDH
jgi:uracil-DNA glycosylase